MRYVFVLLGLAVLPLTAQDIKLPASLDQLTAKAAETVDVTLDSSMLKLAGRFLSDKKSDEAQAKKLLGGLKGIYVRSYEFENAGEYSMADVESVRSQLRGPGWSRIVGVRSKKDGENAEVYVKNSGDQIGGLVVIATEPKELTIVNIVGTIDPEQLSDLGGQFGIPKVEVEKKARKEAK
jgi:hypothetical protein